MTHKTIQERLNTLKDGEYVVGEYRDEHNRNPTVLSVRKEEGKFFYFEEIFNINEWRPIEKESLAKFDFMVENKIVTAQDKSNGQTNVIW